MGTYLETNALESCGLSHSPHIQLLSWEDSVRPSLSDEERKAHSISYAIFPRVSGEIVTGQGNVPLSLALLVM